MSDAAHLGLAGLLATMAPRPREVPPPPPDLEAIRQDGWDKGFAAGVVHAEAELVPVQMRLAAAAAALEAACIIDIDRLRPLLAELVRQLAEVVVMAELRTAPEVLLRLVEAALALVRPGEALTLKAHPATLALLQDHLPDLAMAADAGLAADGFEIVGTSFVIATGLGARLAEIMGDVS